MNGAFRFISSQAKPMDSLIWAAKGVVQHVGVMYFFIIPSVVILILWYSYTIKRLDIPKFKNYNEM